MNAIKNILNNMTGTSDTYRRKQDRIIFKPRRMYQTYMDFRIDHNFTNRYNTSRYRNNETPMKQIRVGPGLNQIIQHTKKYL